MKGSVPKEKGKSNMMSGTAGEMTVAMTAKTGANACKGSIEGTRSTVVCSIC